MSTMVVKRDTKYIKFDIKKIKCGRGSKNLRFQNVFKQRDHQHRQLYTYVGTYELLGFAGGSVVKNPPAYAGDIGSIPGSAGSPGVENGNSLQYSCMGNLMGT